MGLRHDIERFHLLFCKSLLTTQDKSAIVLKGGCNLRFFHASNRYSEDIDFDIETIARETLKKRVEKLLNGHVLNASLAAAKIALQGHSAPKQTDTVQRWKVMLRIQGLDVPSKIEFSRRGVDWKCALFEPIEPQLLAGHRLAPTFLSHYDSTGAIHQKIDALAGRTETQARDVYDLDHLFSRNQNTILNLPKTTLEKAISCALSVDFDQFRGQVVEFLEDEAREYFSSIAIWEGLQRRVVSKLEGL